jgi:hypothetical protein
LQPVRGEPYLAGMAPTWEALELPVLQWVLRNGDNGTGELPHRSAEPFAGVPEVTQAQAHEALTRLQEFGLVTGEPVETSDYTQWPRVRPTANGLRVLGEWPPQDSAAVQAALVAVLRSIADELPEEQAEQAGALRRAAGGVGRFTKEVFTGVALGQLQGLGGDLMKGDDEEEKKP